MERSGHLVGAAVSVPAFAGVAAPAQASQPPCGWGQLTADTIAAWFDQGSTRRRTRAPLGSDCRASSAGVT